MAAPALVLSSLLLASCGDPAAEERDAPGPRASSIPEPTFRTVSDTLLSTGAGTDWPTHGGNLLNHRFSPLQQIDTASIRELVPVWIHSTGIEGALETTPIVVGNTMYVTTAGSRVLALNAATGEEQWRFEPPVAAATLCCGPRNNGVAVYGDMVYVSSLDAKLYALDARTGQPAWQATLADPAQGYSATMAPLAVQGRVYVGVGGERYGIRGFLAAFDASTGDELWRWHTIPSPERGGWWGEWAETDPFGTPLNRDMRAERADSAAWPGSWGVGGGGIATHPAYDPETDRIYVNVEGPAPLIASGVRPGDNLYTGSIVALDAARGQRVWHAQYLPHDTWGLSGGSPPFLFDRGGERYVGFAGRTGWVYVFAADSGTPVLRSDNFVPQESLFARPGDEGAIRVAPGANGGNSGTGVAYDPGSGVVFVGGVHQPMVYAPGGEGYRPGQLWLGGELRHPPDEPQWGTISAIDLADGGIRWQKQTPAPSNSDVLATAGGLVFVGQGSGTFDAFDASSGRLLWQFDMGAGVHGGPITYRVGDVQYVVAAAGGSLHFDTAPGDEIVAFALASRRPYRGVNDYGAPEYDRSGPTMGGRSGVRQVGTPPADVAPAPTPDTTPRGVDAGEPRR
jgi:PQQ-dependent dehydrogenase (methanol/ethanol family)